MLGEQQVSSWYKEPWAWFYVGILGMTLFWVVYASSQVFRYQDTTVVDDYYRVGKSINIDLQREKNAVSLHVGARLSPDVVHQSIHVTLYGDLSILPDHLYLSLLSPTEKKYDQGVLLRLTGENSYVGSWILPIEGRFYIALETMEAENHEIKNWILKQEVEIRDGITIDLPNELFSIINNHIINNQQIDVDIARNIVSNAIDKKNFKINDNENNFIVKGSKVYL